MSEFLGIVERRIQAACPTLVDLGLADLELADLGQGCTMRTVFTLGRPGFFVVIAVLKRSLSRNAPVTSMFRYK